MADNVNIIVQDTINDIVVNAAVIVETIDINVQAAVDEVQIIANPNNYVVNINRIIGEQVQSDWDQADDQAPDYIKNKPSIPALTSDLTNDGEDGINPFITAADVTAQVNSDWDATTGVAEILNKPILATVATSGSYNDLSNTPSIPTATSDLTNDGEDGVNPFITAADIPPVTGFVPYTGATQDVDLGEFEIKAGQVEFDQTPTGTAGVGVMRWNDSDGTVDLGLKGGNVTLQIGQESVLRVVNKTATNVNLLEANYQAVRVTGAQGQRLKVDLAQATSDNLSAETIGLVTETINNNQEGFITTSGLVRGINTTGSLQGETWADGDILYLSPTTAGRATKVKPTAPNHLVILGYVIHAHVNQGSIFVKVDNGYELDELHNVKITSAANNNVLAYTLATDIWENKTVETALGFTPVTNARTISTSAPLSGGGDLSANRTLSITQATTSTDGFLTSTNWNTFNNKFTLPALTSGSVLFSNGTTIAQDNSNLFWDDTNNRLGIRRIPGVELDVSGDIRSTGTMFNTATQTNSVQTNGSNLSFKGSGSTTYATMFLSTGNFVLQSGGTFTDAGFKLDVNGTARVQNTLTIKAPGALSTDIAFKIRNSADTLDLVTVNGLGTLTGKGFLGTYFYAGTTYYDNARIYIGSTSNAKFQTFTSGFSIEQGTVTTIQPSAIFELKSTTQGFLPPIMTTTQKNAIATPAAGLVVYDTTLGKLCVRGAAAWETITSI